MLRYVLRIHKETVHAAQRTTFILIALVVQKQKETHLETGRKENGGTTSAIKSEALTL